MEKCKKNFEITDKNSDKLERNDKLREKIFVVLGR